jgi:EpsD family peptidyl-prolyl cis-trans isomerase
MMKSAWAYLAVPVACFALSACDGDGKGAQPKGQVVATVGGDEITRTQLRAELGQNAAVAGANADARRQLEQALLQQIVTRKVLADAARKDGVDKTPEFAMMRERAEETVLVQAYQEKLAKSVPAVSREDVLKFISDNPDIFGQRKVFVVDQIRMARPADPALLERFRPLTTMEQVVALLESEKIPYQRGNDTLDAVGTDPNVVRQIVGLPAGEVFVIPLPGGVLVNQIRETRVQPFLGEPAERYARQVLANQRQQEVVAKQFNAVLADAKKNVNYGKGFEPKEPAPTKAGGPAAPTAAQPAQKTPNAG